MARVPPKRVSQIQAEVESDSTSELQTIELTTDPPKPADLGAAPEARVGIDVQTCARCGATMRIIESNEDPLVIKTK